MHRRWLRDVPVLLILLCVAGTFLLRMQAGVSSLPSFLIALNVVTVGAYAYDKQAARRASRYRVSERTLHLLALCGGTPGAWCGQRVFRHKTLKRSFRGRFHLIVGLQVGLVVGWFFWVGRHRLGL